jgi:CheY-like chemotaxis protein
MMNNHALHSATDEAGRSPLSIKRRPGEAPVTIMLVEDSADVRMMMKIILEMDGYRVIEAADGLRAVEMALAERPALIVMDLHLPLLDGITATARIREHLRDVQIIALSGYATPEHRRAALGAGFTDYLVKPLDFKHLNRILSTLSC